MDKKKRFEKPELEIVLFEGELATDDDAIGTSEEGSLDEPGFKSGDINPWW